MERGGSHLEGDAVGRQHFLDTLDLQAHDFLDFLLVEGGEHDGLIDAVEEFRADGLFEHVKHLLLGFLHGFIFVLGGHLGEVVADDRRAHVGGHYDDGVLEVDHTALVVGEAAVVKHLKQDVEHVGMGFLDFVEQHHGVRLASDGLCQLAPLVISNISRRRSHEAADGMFLLILAHVDSGHHVFVVKEVFGQCLGQLGLSDSGCAEEDE